MDEKWTVEEKIEGGFFGTHWGVVPRDPDNSFSGPFTGTKAEAERFLDRLRRIRGPRSEFRMRRIDGY